MSSAGHIFSFRRTMMLLFVRASDMHLKAGWFPWGSEIFNLVVPLSLQGLFSPSSRLPFPRPVPVCKYLIPTAIYPIDPSLWIPLFTIKVRAMQAMFGSCRLAQLNHPIHKSAFYDLHIRVKSSPSFSFLLINLNLISVALVWRIVY